MSELSCSKAFNWPAVEVAFFPGPWSGVVVVVVVVSVMVVPGGGGDCCDGPSRGSVRWSILNLEEMCGTWFQK